jgi:peptidyl-prolyl cis-trans isomerase A (cyclophilin A)
MRWTALLLSALFVSACGKSEAPPKTEGPSEALFSPHEATETAPAEIRVRFETTKGHFVVKAVREWAPHGVDRLYNLVRIGYFDDCMIHRVMPGFVAQFGVHGEPDVSSVWTNARIEVDPVKVSNERGFLTFAQIGEIGPASRTTQLFVNLRNNSNLDKDGFAPIGQVVEGMEVVDQFYSGYGNNFDLRAFRALGNRYMKKQHPEMDIIVKATLITE